MKYKNDTESKNERQVIWKFDLGKLKTRSRFICKMCNNEEFFHEIMRQLLLLKSKILM